MANDAVTRAGGDREGEIREAAENLAALQIAREVLERAPGRGVGEAEKREIDRIKGILDFAERLFENPESAEGDAETEAAAESWNAFLHAFLRFILDEPENVRRRIENVFQEIRQKTAAGRED